LSLLCQERNKTLNQLLNIVTVDGSTSIDAEVSQNGLNHSIGLSSSDGTVSLSPDAAVKEADTTDLSRTSGATSPMSHAGTFSNCCFICCFPFRL